ncbi:MAG TPA: hypothetical protein VGD14_22300, partial [bacterium]
MSTTNVLEAKPLPKITIQEKKLTVLMAKDNGNYCASCPELNLVTAMETEEATLNDLLEAMQDYAQEYLGELSLYRNSPNRAHHYPYIRAI